ncbi:MAG TPA: hypothetical protein ENK91_15975 [Bacteroidetes bacterium]|nr:hypothetical protein [Bacteroidota bacterium]
MHDIEPFFKWRDEYRAEEDDRSPFYGREYDEFGFTNSVYNYYIHPQWDDFGSSTLYLKLLFVNYSKRYAIIELIGEWNDTIYNDVMFFKRNICDHLIKQGIIKFILISDNVLNFHGSDDSYYQEWWEDIRDEEGWITNLNLLEHVREEMLKYHLEYYINFPIELNEIEWRLMKPDMLFEAVDKYISKKIKRLK